MPVGTVAAVSTLLSRRTSHSVSSSDGEGGTIGDTRSTSAQSLRAMHGLRSLRKTLADGDEDAKVPHPASHRPKPVERVPLRPWAEAPLEAPRSATTLISRVNGCRHCRMPFHQPHPTP